MTADSLSLETVSIGDIQTIRKTLLSCGTAVQRLCARYYNEPTLARSRMDRHDETYETGGLGKAITYYDEKLPAL